MNPDLLYDVATFATQEIISGEPLVLQSAILNDQAICNNCITFSSIPSMRAISMEYKMDNDSPWANLALQNQNGNDVLEIIKPVPEIQPAGKHIDTDGFIFTNPGLYRFKLICDYTNIVDERNETNNEATSPEGDVKAAGANNNGRVYNLIVQVNDPTGTYPPVPSGKKPVPVVYIEY